MKKILWFLILSVLLQTMVFGSENDIIIKSRFDESSSSSFVKRIRTFLINNDLGDPFNQTFEGPIVIDLNEALDKMPPNTQKWIKELQSVLQLKLFESSYRLVIEELSYSVDEFTSYLRPLNSQLNRIEYVTSNKVQGVQINARKISVEVELKRTQNGEPIIFSVEILDPIFRVSPQLNVELPMKWLTSVMPENILISLFQINLTKIFKSILVRPDLIDLNVRDFIIPEVAIRVGSKELKLDRVKIKKFLVNNKEPLKKGILDLIQGQVQGELDNVIQGSPKDILLSRTYVLKSAIIGIFDLQKMSNDKKEMLRLDIHGHFCLKEVKNVFDQCRNNQVKAPMRRLISPVSFDRSLAEIDNYLQKDQANIAVSVSENYLNQIIEATIQAGLWEEELAGMDFELGPEKAFVLADEKGENFTLYLDIIYKLRGAQRVMVGRSELRFPVKFHIGLKIVNPGVFPHLQITVKKVVTDEQMIINGLPQYGLISSVKNVRFRNKVVSKILEDISTFNGNMLVDFEIEAFKDSYLQKLQFFSDGHGRGTAVLSFDEEEEITVKSLK